MHCFLANDFELTTFTGFNILISVKIHVDGQFEVKSQKYMNAKWPYTEIYVFLIEKAKSVQERDRIAKTPSLSRIKKDHSSQRMRNRKKD